jgi:hypothetical protein
LLHCLSIPPVSSSIFQFLARDSHWEVSIGMIVAIPFFFFWNARTLEVQSSFCGSFVCDLRPIVSFHGTDRTTMYCKTGHHNQSSPVQINICYIYCLYALNTYLCLYVQYYWLSRISRLSPAQLVRLQGRGGGIAGGAEDCRQYLGTVLRRDQYYCIACCRSTIALTVYCTVRCDSTVQGLVQHSAVP